jgi:predicted ATPase
MVYISDAVRRLGRKWDSGNGWPKRLEWIEVSKIRGWTGQRVPFNFPIVAIVGENGSGKSTLLQAAACVYQAPAGERTYYPTEFFPETAWDQITDAEIRFGYQQGQQHPTGSVRKPTTRWLGQPDRPERPISYIDLSRLQPVATRVGYARIAKNKHAEKSARNFSDEQLKRFSEVMGRDYDSARIALSDYDANRPIPVLRKNQSEYSGFHQGSGETTIAELLDVDLPKYGLVLIDEIESSLHPRAQRRLIRDLAEAARLQECQIILSTHSPYILEELPLNARNYILETGKSKEIVTGVSPQFAMTKMDDEPHPECELYVEDERAATMLNEILSAKCREIFPRTRAIPYGAANLGMALGQMVAANRFPRPTVVFLDGDNDNAPGCMLLPGGDAPERVVFGTLRKRNPNWGELWTRIGRDVASTADACERAMLLGDHHDWVKHAANQLQIAGETLWQAMCAEYASKIAEAEVNPVRDAIEKAIP